VDEKPHREFLEEGGKWKRLNHFLAAFFKRGGGGKKKEKGGESLFQLREGKEK